MKFCAVICELDPFHNGHKYLFEKIREAGYAHILCIMSGNFTQRGEAAVFHKLIRARHAVENGADAVIELPAAFSVSPAELFARGAVHILSSLENVEALAFGCEEGDASKFLHAANALSREDEAFRRALKSGLHDGTSYIRARNAAVLEADPALDENFLSTPNNILGIEYCRALLAEKSGILPLPILRAGAMHGDRTANETLSSSTAIRGLMERSGDREKKLLRSNLPETVYRDAILFRPISYKRAALLALLRSGREAALAPDCSEGLENRLLSLAKANPDYDLLVKKSVTKRYTRSRIKRILMQNFLGIRRSDVQGYLSSPLYLKTLAVREEHAEELLASLSGPMPLIARKNDCTLLMGDALACFQTDLRANDLYNALTGTYTNEFLTLFV